MSSSCHVYERACYVCGKRSQQEEWWSSSRGSCLYLDGKPTVNGLRDSDEDDVQRCPHCGYIAQDISVGDERIVSVVNSVDYQQLRTDRRLPESARGFLCGDLLEHPSAENAGGERAARRARWQQLAAWACEDAGDVEGARACRRKAAALMMIRWEGVGSVPHEQVIDLVVIADNLRRSEQFAAALEWIDQRLTAVLVPRARAQLEYERSLAADEDSAPHSTFEALQSVARKVPDDSFLQ
jgi:hypothetical protein